MSDKKYENSAQSKSSPGKAESSPQPPKPPAAMQAQAPEEPAKPGPAEKEPKGAAGQPRAGGPGGAGQAPPKGGPTQPPPRKGGRGLAFLALLIALGAAGGSAYLWYLWQQAQQAQPDWAAQLNTRMDRVMGEVTEQRQTALQDLENQLQSQLQTQQEEVRQALNNQVQALQGEIQSLRDSLQAQRGDAQTLRSQISNLEGELQNLQSRLNERLQDQRQTIAQLDNRIENLQLGQRGLVNTLEAVKVLAARGGDVNALPLSEVEYLLRLAHHKLQFQQDVQAALDALKIANKRLETIGEETFNSVQRMIRENIATLQGVDLPDRSALAHKIAEMAQRVTQLPIRIDMQMASLKEKVAPAMGGEGEPAQAATEAPWWERAADVAWRQFKDIVTVRHERTSGPPLIAPEEEYFLRQNLRLELEAMRLALLRGDATNYQESNETARNWTKTYFDAQDEQVQTFLDELQGLQSVKMHPYIPDISDTLQAFRSVMERREPVRSVISTTEAAGAAPAQEATTPATPEDGEAEAEEAQP